MSDQSNILRDLSIRNQQNPKDKSGTENTQQQNDQPSLDQSLEFGRLVRKLTYSQSQDTQLKVKTPSLEMSLMKKTQEQSRKFSYDSQNNSSKQNQIEFLNQNKIDQLNQIQMDSINLNHIDSLNQHLIDSQYQFQKNKSSLYRMANKKSKLEQQVDKELEQLDQLLLMQNAVEYKYHIEPHLHQKQQLLNLQNILDGKFHEKLFEGLGLPLINLQDNEIDQRKNVLFNLKIHNNNTIAFPLLNAKQNTIPGIQIPPSFNTSPQKAVVAYRYDIQITKQQILNLRQFQVDEGLLEFFLCFLDEFSNSTSTEQSRTGRQMRIGRISSKLYGELYSYKHLGGNRDNVDFKFENQYLQKYDKLIVPIQAGFQGEHQLVLIIVQQYRLIHYHLCTITQTQPTNKILQIKREWQFNDVGELEKANLNDQRRKQLDLNLQLILYWVKSTAQHHNLQKQADMKEWRIKLGKNAQVKSVRQCGVYFILLCSLLYFGQPYDFHNEKLLDVLEYMQQIIEQVVCNVGVGLRQLNFEVIGYFKNEMQNIIKMLR